MGEELIGGVEEHLRVVHGHEPLEGVGGVEGGLEQLAENVELFGDGRGLVDEDEELRELEANERDGGVVLELGEKGGKTWYRARMEGRMPDA